MGTVMRRGRKHLLHLFVILALLLMLFIEAVAADNDWHKPRTDFHGYVESSLVLRDTNGFQYGFMDQVEAVQQKNTLKFDIDVDPAIGMGSFAIEKFHMTFRGAYDSIFDLRKDEYKDIPENMGLSRFDYGLKDIRFESDLREIFIDITYSGPLGQAFFRPGRQLVSWGEASSATLLDVICPKDNSSQMFFQNPDDLLTPVYMARLNYSLPPQPNFNLNFDLLWIPDVRPTQFGPLDHSMSAPYTTFIFQGLKSFNVKQDVPTDKQEYGAKVTADLGIGLSLSAVYFRDMNNDPATVLKDFVGPAPTTAAFTHPMQDVYGGYFSYHFAPLDAVIRGEFSHYTATPIAIPRPDVVMTASGMELRTFRLKPVTQWMIGFDKKYLVKWLSARDTSSFTCQWIHKKINGWDSFMEKSTLKDFDLFTFSA
ncbi:MAG: hypothetical protein FP814_00850, partial [Desulfobacterium sp.]|nr:hypothetical protein [Desulfobacterium sp.]MBU4037978.1 hypothetical protein [Pseudomonadota bacterium]